MKTLTAKTITLLIAPMMALAPLTRVFAQENVAKEGSAEFAVLSQARIDTILQAAEEAARETSSETDRKESVERIGSVLSTLSPTEKVNLIDRILEELPQFTLQAKQRANQVEDQIVASGSVVILALLAPVFMEGKVNVRHAISYLIAAGAIGAVGHNVDKRSKILTLSRQNIESLQASLDQLRSAYATEARVQTLK